MTRFLLAGLAAPLLTICVHAQPKAEQPLPLQYTVRTEQGNRSSRNRDSVLKTVKMTPDQVRAWAEDAQAAKEDRSATLFQDGYVEMIDRGPTGDLQYTVRDRAGVRACQDRGSVLKTRKMTADQLKAWAQATEGKAEKRRFDPWPKGVALQTVSNEKGRVTSRDGVGASEVLKLTAEKIREWASDPKAEKAGRTGHPLPGRACRDHLAGSGWPVTVLGAERDGQPNESRPR